MDNTRQITFSMPELVLIGVTRILGGAGLALVLSEHATLRTRRTMGWTLLITGSLFSIPLLFRKASNQTFRLGPSFQRGFNRGAKLLHLKST